VPIPPEGGPSALWRRIGLWLPAVALAVVAVVAGLRAGGAGDTGAGTASATDGALQLRIYLSGYAGSTDEQQSGAVFREGDVLRFKVKLPRDGHVAIVGVEANGKPYPVWPLPPIRDGRMARTTAADGPDGRLLHGAFQLDGSRGREVLHLVLCPDAPPACAPAGDTLQCGAGCTTAPFVMKKVD
jgi:hypothetical protein